MTTKRINLWLRKGSSLFAGIGMAAAMLCGWNVNAGGRTVDLRGYGKVTATTTRQRSEFICENEEKADQPEVHEERVPALWQ